MKRTLAIIEDLYAEHGDRVALAYSGGSDSTVLLDIVYRHTPHRPPLVWTDTGMEYPGTETWIRKQARRYKATLHIARPTRTPAEQWTAQGWPFLGKAAARVWNRTHKNFGYKLNVTACCRRLKILPGRQLIRDLGCTAQLTGQRGQQDDQVRGKKALDYGPIHYVKADKLTVANPLDGWTDTMTARYTAEARLPQHPARRRGAITIGCLYCGGGCQYTNSGIRVLRRTAPDLWHAYIVGQRAGEIILSIKLNAPLADTQAAIAQAGGLEKLAAERPWIFDFTRHEPIQGYTK